MNKAQLTYAFVFSLFDLCKFLGALLLCRITTGTFGSLAYRFYRRQPIVTGFRCGTLWWISSHCHLFLTWCRVVFTPVLHHGSVFVWFTTANLKQQHNKVMHQQWQSLLWTLITLRAKLSGTVYCNQSCLWVCFRDQIDQPILRYRSLIFLATISFTFLPRW